MCLLSLSLLNIVLDILERGKMYNEKKIFCHAKRGPNVVLIVTMRVKPGVFLWLDAKWLGKVGMSVKIRVKVTIYKGLRMYRGNIEKQWITDWYASWLHRASSHSIEIRERKKDRDNDPSKTHGNSTGKFEWKCRRISINETLFRCWRSIVERSTKGSFYI